MPIAATPVILVEKLVAEADILTFHTPLNMSGPYATHHLVDADLLAQLPADRILINACRGEVVDNAALLEALNGTKKLTAVLDVWEPEPDLSLALLDKVAIGAAHIAGYSLEGKARGTTQVFEAFSQFIGQPQTVPLESLLPAPEFAEVTLRGALSEAKLLRLIHLVYDVRRDDRPLRRVAGKPVNSTSCVSSMKSVASGHLCGGL